MSDLVSRRALAGMGALLIGLWGGGGGSSSSGGGGAPSAPGGGPSGPPTPVPRAPSVVAVSSLQSGVLDIFAATANGATPPQAMIATNGSMNTLGSGMTYDASGTLYAAQIAPARVIVYAPGAVSTSTPARIVTGSLTRLSTPYAVALDPAGDLVVANASSGEITIYAAGANGNAAPIHAIAGNLTGFSANGLRAQCVAVDGAGNVYVGASSNLTGGAVFVFAPGAYGNVAPVRTISGPATGVDGPSGIAVTAAGQLYVVNNKSNDVTIFAPGANGNVGPVGGFTTPTVNTGAIAIDALGDVYVIDQQSGVSGSYLVFGPTDTLIGTPIATVSGAADRFSQAFGIAAH